MKIFASILIASSFSVFAQPIQIQPEAPKVYSVAANLTTEQISALRAVLQNSNIVSIPQGYQLVGFQVLQNPSGSGALRVTLKPNSP